MWRPGDCQLGPWGPARAVDSAGQLAQSAAHPTRRQQAAWRALGLLFAALALLSVLVWAVGAGCSNAYDRGEGCKVADDVACAKPSPGPGSRRAEVPETTTPWGPGAVARAPRRVQGRGRSAGELGVHPGPERRLVEDAR